MTNGMRKEIQDRNQSTAIVDEARKLAVDVLYSEKGHFAASSWWRFVNYALGIPSVLLGVFAGASILQQEGSELLAALAALLASALTALNTFLDPSQRASQHQQTGTAYGRLRRIIRQFVQIEGLATESVSELREQLNDLTESVSDIQKDALPISKRAYTKATKSIKAGSSEYTPQELDAATGPKVAE